MTSSRQALATLRSPSMGMSQPDTATTVCQLAIKAATQTTKRGTPKMTMLLVIAGCDRSALSPGLFVCLIWHLLVSMERERAVRKTRCCHCSRSKETGLEELWPWAPVPLCERAKLHSFAHVKSISSGVRPLHLLSPVVRQLLGLIVCQK